jgi:hypothetical protein
MIRSFSVSYVIRGAWHDSQPPMGSGPRGLARQLGDRRTKPKGIGTKCETAQEQAPRGRDLQSTLLFLRFFRQRPDPPLKQPRKG